MEPSLSGYRVYNHVWEAAVEERATVWMWGQEREEHLSGSSSWRTVAACNCQFV